MATASDHSIQVHPAEVPHIGFKQIRDYQTDVLFFCTTNDENIAKYWEGILKAKQITAELYPVRHDTTEDSIDENEKNSLFRKMSESSKTLIIVSVDMKLSPYLKIILDFTKIISQQRDCPILIVYKMPSVTMSKLPRQLRSGSSIVPIRKDKYTDERYITHDMGDDSDVHMDMLGAIKFSRQKLKLNNLARGLVTSFFIGYLEFKLPELKNAIQQVQDEHATCCSLGNIYPKLVILLPESCNIPNRLDVVDSNINYMNCPTNNKSLKAEIFFDRGGVKQRDYSSSLCTVKGTVYQQEKEYVCAVEYATPLNHMYELWRRSNLYDYTEVDKDDDYEAFIDNLVQIIGTASNCRDSYLFVEYDDTDTSVPLSQRIVTEIANDIIRQETVQMVAGMNIQ